MSETTDVSQALRNIQALLQQRPNCNQIQQQYKINFDIAFAQANKTACAASVLGSDIQETCATWTDITHGMPDEIAQMKIQVLAMGLQHSQEAVTQLKAEVNNLNMTSNDIIGELDNLSGELNNQISAEQAKINNLNQSLQGNAAQITSVQSQLSGSSGFWQGFLTGITAGIYSGLRDKLSHLRDLRNSYNSEIQQLQITSIQLTANCNTINQAKSLMSTFSGLYTGVVALENVLVSINALIAQTQHDGDKIITTNNEPVAKFFLARFGNDMNALLQWKNIMS